MRHPRLQVWVAVILVVAGVGLLIAGFVVKPTGEIHNSVLVAFGEILTFIGAIIGIDYHYKLKELIQSGINKSKGNESTD